MLLPLQGELGVDRVGAILLRVEWVAIVLSCSIYPILYMAVYLLLGDGCA